MCVESYFNTLEEVKDNTPTPMSTPTPEGFARAVGFSNFRCLMDAVRSPDILQESRHYLLVGCSMIADWFTKYGVNSKVSTTFTKFIMSAQLDISEKTEVTEHNDTNITITWRAPDSETSQKDIIEMERLEKALPARMRIPSELSIQDII